MRNNIQRGAIRLRDSIELRDHLRIRFHEASGTAVAYTGRRNGTDFSGSITLAAAPTWGSGGAKCPSSNATVYGIATQDSHPDLVALLTPNSGGGLAFLWSFFQTAYTNNSANNSDLLSFGNMNAGGDGYRIGFSQGANNNVTSGIRAIGGVNNANAKVANTLNTWQTVQQYIKTVDGALAAYSAVNGNWSSAAVVTDTGSFSHTAPANYNAVSIFNAMGSGPVVGSTFMNRGATDDKIISDLWVIPDADGSLLDSMATLALEHANFPRESLLSLAR